MSQTVAQELERLEVLTYADIQKANRCQNLRIFWRKFEAFKVHFDRALVVLLDLEHATELYVGVLMLMDHISLREIGDGVVIAAQKLETQSFVEVNLPIFSVKVRALFENLDRCLVSSD